MDKMYDDTENDPRRKRIETEEIARERELARQDWRKLYPGEELRSPHPEESE